MFSLPRGTGPVHDVPLTSAAWERPEAIERLVYQGHGALFLGAIPANDMWPKLGALRGKATTLLAAIDQSRRPPLERARLVLSLEEIWRAAQLAETVPLGLRDDRHMVTVAGARSGKGRSVVVPNLSLYPGSVLVIDPKGENASLTAERRGPGSAWCEGMGQEVYVLDPFGTANVPDALRAGMNPLAVLDVTADTIIDDAALLADALVVPSGKDSMHWDESARNYIQGVVLYLVATRAAPTLFTLRRFLTQGDLEGWTIACTNDPALIAKCPDALRFLWRNMTSVDTGNPGLDDAIVGAAETIAQCGENERGSILSTARRNTAFLDSVGPRYRETLEGKSSRLFHPDSLKHKQGGVSVYLCLPAARMGAHSRWLRVVINLVLERMQRSLAPPVTGMPVLFVLDEFFTLGPMNSIENAAGFAAGFGVKLWPILQDLQQLKAMYPNSWQTFLANAAAVQVFGAADAETCDYVSKALGEVETRQTVVSVNSTNQHGFGAPSDSERVSPIIRALGSKQIGVAAIEAARAMLLDDASTSGGGSTTANSGESITLAPLLRPDEVAQQFSTDSGAALVMIKGRRPVWCLRVDYDTSPWFAGRYTPLPHLIKPGHQPSREPQPFGVRHPARYAQCMDALNSLVTTIRN